MNATKAKDTLYSHRYALLISLILLLVMAMASIGSLSADTTNLLSSYNPGFEDSGSGIPQWTRDYGTVSVVTSTMHSGSKSLQCNNGCKAESNYKIPVEAGYIYHIGVWGKYSNFTFTGKYGMGFGLEQRRSDGTINGNWYDMMCYLDYPTQDNASRDWFYVESAAVVPKETTSVLVPVFKVDAVSGQVWWDDIVVWKEPAPDLTLQTYINMIENGSFEVFMGDGKPNGYTIKAPDGMYNTYSNNFTCTQDTAYNRATSLKMTGECVLTSNAGYMNTTSANAKIAVKTDNIVGNGVYAKLVFYDSNMAVIGSRDVVSLTGTNGWQVFTSDLSTVDSTTRYAQWEFGMKSGTTGTVYFDDLQVNVPSTLQKFPYRDKDTANGNVTVDCSALKNVFTSPLNSFDTGGAWVAYSPTIGTAGKWVEGPGRWYSQRANLGFKYVRLHDVYQLGCWTAGNDGNGNWTLNTSTGRTKYPDSSDGFPAYYSVDSNNVAHYDFSVYKDFLDKAVLKNGCKPIIGLCNTPPCIAKNWNWQYVPASDDAWNKWEDLNYQFVKFLVDTYGKDEVLSWIFETGNEPSTVFTFRGDPDNPSNVMNDFFKLQDYSIHGATRALPDIFIAGPSGPPESWVEPMLTHCATGTNYFTGQVGTKIDAISYHGYLGGSAVDMSWRQAEDQILRYQGYIDRYYQKTGKRLQLFNTEFSPDYSEGAPALASIPDDKNNHIQAIAAMHTGFISHRLGVDMLTFFREAPLYMVNYSGVPMTSVPEFTGLSTCVTYHGIFTPLSRAYQMMSMLNGGNEVTATADKDPIYAIATATSSQIKVLCYSFDVNPQLSYTTSVNISINPASIGTTFNVTRYVLSSTSANSWYLAKQRGLTQADCAKDDSIIDSINQSSQLNPVNVGQARTVSGKLNLNISMPAYSAVLFVLDKVN